MEIEYILKSERDEKKIDDALEKILDLSTKEKTKGDREVAKRDLLNGAIEKNVKGFKKEQKLKKIKTIVVGSISEDGTEEIEVRLTIGKVYTRKDKKGSYGLDVENIEIKHVKR